MIDPNKHKHQSFFLDFTDHTFIKKSAVLTVTHNEFKAESVSIT